jgi:hypothetical protein
MPLSRPLNMIAYAGNIRIMLTAGGRRFFVADEPPRGKPRSIFSFTFV